MNKTFLFGILFAAIVVISLTISPTFSDKDKKLAVQFALPDIESAVLSDVVKADGKNAYWELTAALDGNLVKSTKALEGDSKGAGILIKPDNDHVYTVGVHTYNNCENIDCGDYRVHGHASRIVESSATCSDAGYEFESIAGSVHDLGTGHITYKSGQDKTIISLVNIDATLNELVDPAQVCDNSSDSDVGLVYLFNTRVISDNENNIHLCVHLSEPETLENASINGFTFSKTPSLCPAP
ncbi:MAG: hypothetical protein ACT4N5_04805 [Nitrosopumilaceae archaeon]